jgi:hypothetical protein
MFRKQICYKNKLIIPLVNIIFKGVCSHCYHTQYLVLTLSLGIDVDQYCFPSQDTYP